eukprot:2946228-Prorocentrum_lima.AAC.1
MVNESRSISPPEPRDHPSCRLDGREVTVRRVRGPPSTILDDKQVIMPIDSIVETIQASSLPGAV